MKSLKYLVFLVCPFLVLKTYAQPNMELSFSVSPSVNWISSDQKEVSRDGTVAGFDFGLNADFYLDGNERYALTTGLLVVNTGGKLNYQPENSFEFAGSTFSGITNIRYRLQYLEVPFAVKLRTSQMKRWVYWGQFGLSGYVNVRARGDSDNGELDKSSISSEVENFDLGMNVGLGANFDINGKNAVVAGINYKNGFFDVTKDNAFSERAIRHSVVLKLGLVF